MPSDLKSKHEKILSKKWEKLSARGLVPPKDAEENRKRAKEAHGY